MQVRLTLSEKKAIAGSLLKKLLNVEKELIGLKSRVMMLEYRVVDLENQKKGKV